MKTYKVELRDENKEALGTIEVEANSPLESLFESEAKAPEFIKSSRTPRTSVRG